MTDDELQEMRELLEQSRVEREARWRESAAHPVSGHLVVVSWVVGNYPVRLCATHEDAVREAERLAEVRGTPPLVTDLYTQGYDPWDVDKSYDADFIHVVPLHGDKEFSTDDFSSLNGRMYSVDHSRRVPICIYPDLSGANGEGQPPADVDGLLIFVDTDIPGFWCRLCMREREKVTRKVKRHNSKFEGIIVPGMLVRFHDGVPVEVIE